jgi:hypothetical protein
MLLFNECYLNPSVQIGSDSADEMRPIFSAFSEEMPVELEIQTAKMIKVLLRKQSNRSNIGKYGLNAVIKVMFIYTFVFDKFILRACYYMFKINELLINLNVLYSKALVRQSHKRTLAASEIGNAVLNTCYNGENVNLFIESGGVGPLLDLLRTRDPAILASTLGAIQGICYVPVGRQQIKTDVEVDFHAISYCLYLGMSILFHAYRVCVLYLITY